MVWDQESSLPHIFPLIRSSTPAMAMVFIQLNSAVAIILSKMATDSGMSQFVMVTYRHAVATLVIAPIAFFVERKEKVKLRSGKGREKLLGVIACVCGVALMILFKGMLLKPCARRLVISNDKQQQHSGKGNWLLGLAFLFGFCISWSSSSMLQSGICST
ncbi:unnamed protein product [Victoria cruziana]